MPSAIIGGIDGFITSVVLFPDDDTVIAVATDAPLPDTGSLPQLDLNRPDEIAAFVYEYAIKENPHLQTAKHVVNGKP